jgi:flotillin
VDKITIVSTGNDSAAGASKITGDMAKIAAQVPALFEAFSGMNMNDLLSGVRQLKKKADVDGDAAKKKSAGAGSGQTQ